MSIKLENEELLEELKRIIKMLGRIPKKNELKNYCKYSHNAYTRAFGSYNNALIAAGETPSILRNLTKEDIILEVQRIYKETNKIPSTREFDKYASTSYRSAKTIIGDLSWDDLLVEAGIKMK